MEVYQSSKTAAEMEYALSAIPSIGANNHWFIGDQDTGVLAEGLTPYVGENDHWFIGDTDTGIMAQGLTPYVGANGNWWVGETDTGVYAGGVKVEGAQVGQTIVVKAVDENGKPTEWEAADIPPDWEVINDVTLAEPITKFILSVDKDGNPFALDEFEAYLYATGLEKTDGWYLYKTTGPYQATTSAQTNMTTNVATVISGKAGSFYVRTVYQYGYDGTSRRLVKEPLDSENNPISVPMDCFGFNNFGSGAVMPAGTRVVIVGRRKKV